VRSQADADAWASRHPEGHGQPRDRAAADTQGDSRDDARGDRDAALVQNASARAASAHNGRVDYIA